MDTIIGIWIIAIFVAGCVGMVKAFMRSPIVAILLLIFFLPGLWVWGLIECVTGPIKKPVQDVRIVNDKEY